MTYELDMQYVNIAMRCTSASCKTNKYTWFVLTQTKGDKYRQIFICDDCAYEVQEHTEFDIYDQMVKYSIKMNYDWPKEWVDYSERGEYNTFSAGD